MPIKAADPQNRSKIRPLKNVQKKIQIILVGGTE
jgi:hypothetical protein